MDSMEHAIEQAARTEADKRHGGEYVSGDDMLARRSFIEGAEWAVEHLRAQGLLAPAPLREEWAVEGALDSGDDWIADCEFATRLGAEDFLNSNEWARRDGGHVSRRYFTDWLPADRAEGDGSADQ